MTMAAEMWLTSQCLNYNENMINGVKRNDPTDKYSMKLMKEIHYIL